MKKFIYETSQWMKFSYGALLLVLLYPINEGFVLVAIVLALTSLVINSLTTKAYNSVGLGIPLLGNRVCINQLSFASFKCNECPYINFMKGMKKLEENADKKVTYYTYTHKTIVDQISKSKKFEIIKCEPYKEGSLKVEKFLLGLKCHKCRKNNKCILQTNGTGSRMFYCVEFKVK